MARVCNQINLRDAAYSILLLDNSVHIIMVQASISVPCKDIWSTLIKEMFLKLI